MPSLDETFKAVGVTSARDKILALCNAPALFFNVSPQYSEDHILVHTVSYVVGRILANEVSPNNAEFNQHIRFGLFEQPIDTRRNLMHSLGDPGFLDAYMDALRDTEHKLRLLRTQYLDRCKDLISGETGVPLLDSLALYRKYHANEVPKHN